MGRNGRQNGKRAHGLLHRHATPRHEWAMTELCHELLDRGRVAAAVSQRTGGHCYWPGCTAPIVSYPHAVPQQAGGVHHQLNRGGLCGVHATALHRGGPAGEQYRLFLQEWLIDWYAPRGVASDRWMALATGQDVIPDLTSDIGEEAAV